ncbi:hypothetical protein M5J15_15660 [Serratia symbiotica]|uniref:hypothetical protein n=1 Tax=Serratia symbiotica TaxID=138074 RepID=UPI001D1D81AD|nr:hypothetical protein [Serratia symbiotica]NIG88499.1 hypothetical protein [Serratia symbiotica]USS95676.1 hypothetical protein M5J15_15660 [Serratia symbiotica]
MISDKSVNEALSRFDGTRDIIEFLFGTAEGLDEEERYAEAETLREAIDSLSGMYATLTNFACEIPRLNLQVERLKDRLGE